MCFISDPVLSLPTGPPKRALLAVPGATRSQNIDLRVRLMSYNILAEQYATKQM